MEPWLVSEIRISGDLKLISILASGLPTSEDSEHIIDLESLKASPISSQTPLDLFIGVFSTANNFKRRMAVRRTWMQYNAVRSNATAVRFFVGLVGFAYNLLTYFKILVGLEEITSLDYYIKLKFQSFYECRSSNFEIISLLN